MTEFTKPADPTFAQAGQVGMEVPIKPIGPEAQPTLEEGKQVGEKMLAGAGVEADIAVTTPSTEVNPYDQLFDPNYEPAPIGQQSNGLSKAETDAIRQHVDKNIDLVQKFGSTYVNTPPKQ